MPIFRAWVERESSAKHSIYNDVLVLGRTFEVSDDRSHVSDSPASLLVESGCPTPRTQ